MIRLMFRQELENLIHAFIFSRLGYCKGLSSSVQKKVLRQLQLIQNNAATVRHLSKTKTSSQDWALTSDFISL